MCGGEAGVSWCRDNLRLKGEKLHDTNVITRLKTKLTQAESKVAWHRQHADELQRQLTAQAMETDAGSRLVDGLKRKVRELETVGFVMGDRATRFAGEVKPRRAEVERLKEQRGAQDQELARALRLVGSLRAAVQDRDASTRCAAALCWTGVCGAAAVRARG